MNSDFGSHLITYMLSVTKPFMIYIDLMHIIYIYIIKMYFLEQKLSQFLIVIYVMTAQVNCGLKEDDMTNRKIKTLILCCVYVCVFVYIFILYSSIQMENEKNFKAL